MKFLALLCWNPAQALHWYGKDGSLEHKKVVPDLLLVFACAMLWHAMENHMSVPTTATWITLFTAAFGAGMWQRYLDGKPVQISESVHTDVAEVIRAAREYGPRTPHDG